MSQAKWCYVLGTIFLGVAFFGVMFVDYEDHAAHAAVEAAVGSACLVWGLRLELKEKLGWKEK